MTRLTRWLCTRYLPALAWERMRAENERLERALRAERQRTARMRAYIQGMQKTLRLCGRGLTGMEVCADGRNDAGVAARANNG